MDELIRSTIQEALAVEQPPPGLRARVIAAVPMEHNQARPARRPSLRFGPLTSRSVAAIVTIALVAGVVYSRNIPSNHLGRAQQASGARLISPEGIAVAPDGTVYVSDYVGNRVYRLQGDGSLLTVAGGGSAYEGRATKSNIFGPAGLTLDQQGNLYIADNLGGTIRRVDSDGMLTTVATIHGAGSNFNLPLGIAFDASGVLYVGDFAGDVHAIQPDGSGHVVSIAGIAPPTVVPGYLAFDTTGDLYVSDRSPSSKYIGQTIQNPGGGCRILRIKRDQSVAVVAGTGKCGYSGDGGPATNAQLNDPSGIAFDSSGNLYFSDSNNHRIRRIDARGIITTQAGIGSVGHAGDSGSASRATLGYPYGLAMRSGNLLYVADAYCDCMDPDVTGRVRVIRLSDGTITTVASGQSRVLTPS
ncbi:MAG: hypothetical protein E6H82_11545 [Chloroflexi bacterium]|nr:MAG: hypothetical protein E6H82_11545 [Chloroflexota bacterium]